MLNPLTQHPQVGQSRNNDDDAEDADDADVADDDDATF